MAGINYVCTICTQDFTRRYSANRHNLSFHPEQRSIVRVLDYLVGTAGGRYPRPNPLVHPRHRRRTASPENYFFKRNNRADSIAAPDFNPSGKFFSGTSPKNNDDSMQKPQHEQRFQSYSSTNPSAQKQTQRTNNDVFACLDKPQEVADKLLETKKLLSKFGSPQKVNSMLESCWNAYRQTREISVIDQALTDARRVSRWNETMEQLNSDK
jgi:hypothetical protein